MRMLVWALCITMSAVFPASAQSSNAISSGCLPASAPLTEHVARLKNDLKYSSCLAPVAAAVGASCGARPAGGDPAEAGRWRGCIQNATVLQDLAAAADTLQKFTNECRESQLPKPCQAKKDSEDRLNMVIGGLLGQLPSMPR